MDTTGPPWDHGAVTARTPLPPETLAALVAEHDRFLAFLAPRLESRDAAEEVLQAAFVKGWERGGELQDHESAVAWFYRLLRHALVDHYRGRAAERRALDAHAAAQPEGEAPEIPELAAALCRCLDGLLPTLPPDQAALLRQVDLEGRPVSEVAASLGLTPNATSVRLHRSRKALKARLETTCGTCTTHGCLDCTCRPGTGHTGHGAG